MNGEKLKLKMKITENNYEAWLLDHLEGRLDGAQTALLMQFLREHPQLEADTSLELMSLAQPGDNFINAFHHLRKPEDSTIPTAGYNQSNYEEAFAAFYEGDLDQQRVDGLRHFVDQNPALAADFELFGKLRMEVDHNIVCPGKDALRRHKRVSLYVRWSIPVSVAAASVALFLLFNPQQRGTDNVGTDMGPVVAVQHPAAGQGAPASSISTGSDDTTTTKAATVVSEIPAATVAAVSATPRESRPVPGLRSIAATEVAYQGPGKQKLIEGSRYYTCLYADIRLRDQIRFQQEVEEQGLQTIYGDAKANAGNNSFDLWSIARLGVKGFNYLTRSDIEFTKARDEEGNVTDFAIGGEAVRIAHSSK